MLVSQVSDDSPGEDLDIRLEFVVVLVLIRDDNETIGVQTTCTRTSESDENNRIAHIHRFASSYQYYPIEGSLRPRRLS